MAVSSGRNEVPWSGGPAGDLLSKGPSEGPLDPPWASAAGQSPSALTRLLSQAAAILAREAGRLPLAPSSTLAPYRALAVAPEAAGGTALPVDPGGRACPVTGVTVPPLGADMDRLRKQAHELVAGLLTMFAPASGNGAGPGVPTPIPGELQSLTGHVCPVTNATVPSGVFDLDSLRKQAHGFIETLLVTFNEATGEKGLPTEDKVPQLRSEAPVQPGAEARAILAVANEETTPSEVALYSTNFVADSGYEIPSLRVVVSPRRATIPARSEATFQIKIAVPQQTPRGVYSGLIQAMGSKYVKAVLSVEVL
jgi:hypothetical protein